MQKKSWIILLLAFFFSSILAAPAADLEKLLGGYTSYQANFSQINYDNKNRAGKQSYGQVFMQRPGKFRWETAKPYEQTVIANGDTLWVYDVDLSQATKQSLAKRGFNPAQLLTEPVANFVQKFTVTQESDGWFKLVPAETDRGFKAAYLQFKNNQLSGLKIINQLNQTNVFSFTQVRVNPNLKASLFTFDPPAGVQVLND